MFYSGEGSPLLEGEVQSDDGYHSDLDYYAVEALIGEEDAGFDEGESSFGTPIWTTQEGDRIPITQMESGHLFNAMKMMFNPLAEAYGGKPVWFGRRWGGARQIAEQLPGHAAWWVVVMLKELDRRTDIPARYLQPLAEIREQVFGVDQRLKGDRPKMLTDGEEPCPF